jgi:hypothetical protein
MPDLAGIPSTDHAPGCDSLSFPLLRFDPPLRLVPENLRPRPLSQGQLSWDSFPLQRSTATRVHVLPFDRKTSQLDPKASSGIRQQVPPCQLRCRSQVFPTSQRPCSSRRHPTIFRQVALMGLHPPGVLSSHEAFDNSSPPNCPLDVSPAGCAAPVLG